MEIRFKPLPAWPYPGDTVAPRFWATWTETLELLDRELVQLGAQDVTVQAGFTGDQIRLDGWPRADARPHHHGVILGFDSMYGPLTYATNRFHSTQNYAHGKGYRDVPGWQANLRAVGLSLEALRAVDRYGVSRRGEQYRGWAALPMSTGGPTSRDAAARLIAAYAGVEPADVMEDEGIRTKAIRKALFGSHPDHGGTDEKFSHVQDAIRLLA